MVVILTALQAEAQSYISHFKLKKDMTVHTFPLYIHDNTALCITGKNAPFAAAVVGFVFGYLRLDTQNDTWLLHTGITQGISGGETDTVLIPHTVIDAVNHHSFYPEPLYRHPFTEGVLTDGTAAVILQAAAKFLPLHRIVAAYGMNADKYADILVWFTQLTEVIASETTPVLFTEDEKMLMDITASRLKLTRAMRVLFDKACTVYKTRSIEKTTDSSSLTALLSVGNTIQCMTKQEGKMAFARLRKTLME